MTTENKIKTVVETVAVATNLQNFGQWLTCLLEFDSLILNEDRHFHNIAVIHTPSNAFKLMPLFDNGAGFCSDTTRDYPLFMSPSICAPKVKAKPFNTSFKKQINACKKLYGPQLRLSMALGDIELGLLDDMVYYSDAVKMRAVGILRRQIGQLIRRTHQC